MAKNLPAMQETRVRKGLRHQGSPLGQEDPLEEAMATSSNILAWTIPTGREAWKATVHEAAKSQARLSVEAQHST